jgi:outer membrane protein OmpA-like peptidoglycan-associated protein
LQIAFAAGESKLPTTARDGLKTLADRLKAEEGLRLQLLAYAGGGDLSASAARRLSLSRALAVRSFLIENGVRSTRIDVRALGDKTTEQPINRVDIHVAER